MVSDDDTQSVADNESNIIVRTRGGQEEGRGGEERRGKERRGEERRKCNVKLMYANALTLVYTYTSYLEKKPQPRRCVQPFP